MENAAFFLSKFLNQPNNVQRFLSSAQSFK
jgi:hypothetical protein